MWQLAPENCAVLCSPLGLSYALFQRPQLYQADVGHQFLALLLQPSEVPELTCTTATANGHGPLAGWSLVQWTTACPLARNQQRAPFAAHVVTKSKPLALWWVLLAEGHALPLARLGLDLESLLQLGSETAQEP
jgi:hypothetical protein